MTLGVSPWLSIFKATKANATHGSKCLLTVVPTVINMGEALSAGNTTDWCFSSRNVSHGSGSWKSKVRCSQGSGEFSPWSADGACSLCPHVEEKEVISLYLFL